MHDPMSFELPVRRFDINRECSHSQVSTAYLVEMVELEQSKERERSILWDNANAKQRKRLGTY